MRSNDRKLRNWNPDKCSCSNFRAQNVIIFWKISAVKIGRKKFCISMNFQYFPISCENGFDLFGNLTWGLFGSPEFQKYLAGRPRYKGKTKLGGVAPTIIIMDNFTSADQNVLKQHQKCNRVGKIHIENLCVFCVSWEILFQIQLVYIYSNLKDYFLFFSWVF